MNSEEEKNANLEAVLLCMAPHPSEVIHLLIDGIHNEKGKESPVNVLLETLLQAPPVGRLHLGLVLVFTITVKVIVQSHCARWLRSLLHLLLLQKLRHMGFASTWEASQNNSKPWRSGESARQLHQGVHPYLGTNRF